MPIGTLFSLCAGILIGVKLYYKLHEKKLHMSEGMRYFLEDLWYGSGGRKNGRSDV